MKKILFITTLACLSLVFACKNDVENSNSSTDVTSKSTQSIDNTSNKLSKQTSKILDDGTRIIVADRVYSDKEKSEMSQLADANKKKEAEEVRKANYASAKKERSKLKKEENDPNKLLDMGGGVKIGKHYDFATYDLPSSCDLISIDFLAKVSKADANVIQVKDASSSRTRYARSCFFKWEVDAVANGGIMLQVQGNPVPKETTTFISEFITNKRKEGEMSMDTNERSTYKTLDGLGVEAIYNHSLNRCYWRIGDEYLFMLAFNLGLEEAEQRAIATKIGIEVLKNFKKMK